MTITFLSGALVTGIVGWVLWKICQSVLLVSPLDKIPGPQPDSFVTGTLGRLLSPDSLDFRKDVFATYGSVIKIKSFFGRNALLVSDPKALHHILIKDQHIYDETQIFIATNLLLFGPGLLSTVGCNTGQVHNICGY